MQMWWWALGAVVLLALVAAVVDGRGRSSRPGGRNRSSRPEGRTRPPRGPSRPSSSRGPRAGDIWWAMVPYEDGAGAKDRPCLVLSVGARSARVAKITTRDPGARPGVVALPAGTVDDARGRASFLETDEVRKVPLRDFRRPAGTLPTDLWSQVRPR
ncbi:type II toxin-antitoxin system PemK/MazF family toxin [Streptomyces sp. NPDC060194]|uniref:type II toxin-antitoxin system PemK/MazF family toxin n=1 Tax=Streptomyces sp. NPDC060194 TaxID=3347069 RepID=UPI0036684F8B